MMEKHILGNVTVCCKEIPDGGNLSRRERERRTVAEIVSEFAGDGSVISHDDDGRPHLRGWHVSVAHSRRLAAVAFCRDMPVGIDAEEWRGQLHDVRARYLSPEEIARAVTPGALLHAWTAKEAVYKIAGRGAVDFARSIRLDAQMTRAMALGEVYRLTSFDTGPTHVTICVPV